MLRVAGAGATWSPGRPGTTGGGGGDTWCDPATGRVVADPSGAAEAPGPVEVLDATGCVVTPGLVNAHHHLLQSAFRTLPGTRGATMASWLAVMGQAYRDVVVDAELVSAAAGVGLAEALLCGVTTVADHHLTWPGSNPRARSGARTEGTDVDLAGAVAGAAEHLGARVVLVRGTAGDDPQLAAASTEAVVAALVPGAPGGVRGDGRVQVAVGPAGVHADARETFALLGEVAARHGLRRRTQANEQVDVAIAAERYGRRPLELLEDWGWLAPDVTLAHLCAITPAELSRVAAAGVSATHAPGCDLPMGWGVAPAAALADAGVALGLGTSGGGSNDAGHLLADARLALQVAPLAPLGARPVTAEEVLGWSTAGAADGLGRPELGRLAVGSAADLVCWDVTGVADAGVADPVAGLLWASPGRRPRHVVVGGRVVVRDGLLVADDEHAVAGRLRAVLAARGR